MIGLVMKSLALWNGCTYPLVHLLNRVPDLIVVHYEVLANEPLESFRSLYRLLDLPFNHTVEKHIRMTSSLEQEPNLGWEVMVLQRNSSATARFWRERLTDEELSRTIEGTRYVRHELRGVRQQVYDDFSD